MPYSLGIVDVDLHCAFDRATTDEYPSGKAEANVHTRMSMSWELQELCRERLADKRSRWNAAVGIMRDGIQPSRNVTQWGLRVPGPWYGVTIATRRWRRNRWGGEQRLRR